MNMVREIENLDESILNERFQVKRLEKTARRSPQSPKLRIL